MHIQTEQVAKNFSRDPTAYEREARLQLRVAHELAKKLAVQLPGWLPERTLELGCGTGFLSERLIGLFPKSEFTFTDISPAMLEYCRKKLGREIGEKSISANFAVHDLTNGLPGGKFDLISSSMTLQWASDLPGVMQQIYNCLEPGGICSFSTLCDGTFAGVRKLFEELGISFPGPQLPSREQVAGAVDKFFPVLMVESSETELHQSPHDFLRQIQAIGAGNPTGSPLNAAQIRKFIRHSRKNYPDEFPVNYELLYAILKKS